LETLPLILVIISAFSHALWNYLAKDSQDKESFMFLLNLYSTAIFFPIFYILIADIKLPTNIVPFLLASGIAETVYFIALGKAYETGDLSIVYPLARSSPLFVAIFALILIKETITAWGIIGIFLVIIGVYVLHLKSLRVKDIRLTFRTLYDKASINAIIAALGTTVYSISDKQGVTLTDPILYSFWLGPVITAMMGAVVFHRKGFKSLRKAAHGNNIRIIASGFLMKGGYLLVLIALSLAKVSYILSIRQLSVVVGTILGLKLLKEEQPKIRMLGSLIIFLGVYILGVLA
jgi:uncharacterized membrane protein